MSRKSTRYPSDSESSDQEHASGDDRRRGASRRDVDDSIRAAVSRMKSGPPTKTASTLETRAVTGNKVPKTHYVANGGHAAAAPSSSSSSSSSSSTVAPISRSKPTTAAAVDEDDDAAVKRALATGVPSVVVLQRPMILFQKSVERTAAREPVPCTRGGKTVYSCDENYVKAHLAANGDTIFDDKKSFNDAVRAECLSYEKYYNWKRVSQTLTDAQSKKVIAAHARQKSAFPPGPFYALHATLEREPQLKDFIDAYKDTPGAMSAHGVPEPDTIAKAQKDYLAAMEKYAEDARQKLTQAKPLNDDDVKTLAALKETAKEQQKKKKTPAKTAEPPAKKSKLAKGSKHKSAPSPAKKSSSSNSKSRRVEDSGSEPEDDSSQRSVDKKRARDTVGKKRGREEGSSSSSKRARHDTKSAHHGKSKGKSKSKEHGRGRAYFMDESASSASEEDDFSDGSDGSGSESEQEVRRRR